MRIIPVILTAALAASAAGAADRHRPIGVETVIPFAANGGLRDWQAGPPRSGVIFVKDRREQWYRVTLSGPCTTNRAMDSIDYKTDANGVFDRFSTLTVGQYPNQICGVTSIRTSLPPKGQPGAPKHEG